jgi:hypothetical protein
MGQMLPDGDIVEMLNPVLSARDFAGILARRAHFLSVSAPWGVDPDGVLLRQAAEVICDQADWIDLLEQEVPDKDDQVQEM